MKKLIVIAAISVWVLLGVSGNVYRTVYVHNLDYRKYLLPDIAIGSLTGPIAWIHTSCSYLPEWGTK